MLDPRSANCPSDCLAIAEAHSGNYPICLGWQSCLEPLLPPLDGGGCLAFLVDDDLGPHFVFDEPDGLTDVPLGKVGFAEPLSELARMWLHAFEEWRAGRLRKRVRALQLIR